MKAPGWPKIDTVKGYGTVAIAAFIVWKSLSMLEGMVKDGAVGGDAALGIIGGLVLAVAGFLFAAEQSKGNQAAFEKGLNTTAPGGTTVNTTGATTVEGSNPTVVTSAPESVLSDQATPGVLRGQVEPE